MATLMKRLLPCTGYPWGTLMGAVGVAAVSEGRPAGLVVAGGLMLAFLVSVWRARRRRLAAQLGLSAHLHSVSAFGGSLSSVWSAQIESSRRQTEEAVTSLAERFSQISVRLDNTLALSLQAGADGHQSAAHVAGLNRDDLDIVVRQLKAGMETKAHMLHKVQGLMRFIDELQDMTHAIGKITHQTSLLAVNASIEAAHAGPMGRGFATVAHEVRALSKQSDETGRLIAQRISLIGQEIEAACAMTEETARGEQEALLASESIISNVLTRFREFSETLTGTTELLRQESSEIQGEVNSALVQLQFQDRVSQMLDHVSSSIGTLPQVLDDYGRRCESAGQLQPLDPTSMLDKLEQSYAMAEERNTHHKSDAPRPGSAVDNDITFF